MPVSRGPVSRAATRPGVPAGCVPVPAVGQSRVIRDALAVVGPGHDVRCRRPDLLVAARTPVGLGRCSTRDGPHEPVAVAARLAPHRATTHRRSVGRRGLVPTTTVLTRHTPSVSDAEREGPNRSGEERACSAEQQLSRRGNVREGARRCDPHSAGGDLQPGAQGEQLGSCGVRCVGLPGSEKRSRQGTGEEAGSGEQGSCPRQGRTNPRRGPAARPCRMRVAITIAGVCRGVAGRAIQEIDPNNAPSAKVVSSQPLAEGTCARCARTTTTTGSAPSPAWPSVVAAVTNPRTRSRSSSRSASAFWGCVSPRSANGRPASGRTAITTLPIAAMAAKATRAAAGEANSLMTATRAGPTMPDTL